MPPELDADLASTMTPEELEAINGEDSPEEKLVMRQAPKDEEGDDEDDSDDDGDDEDAPPVEGKTEDKPADDADEEPQEEPAKPLTPRYEAALPSDYDDQIKALKDRDAELRQKFKDGEIDIDERDAGLAELSEQREQLLVARAKAEISQEMTQQSAAQTWQNTVNTFMARAAKEEGGIDYRKDQAKAEDLDSFVKFLANKQENADKPMEWFLQEAHKRVQALHGVAVTKRETIEEAKAKRKPPLDAAPKTLAQVPGSDGPGDVESEFADIDALDGWELEQAIARMSPTQRAKYLKG